MPQFVDNWYNAKKNKSLYPHIDSARGRHWDYRGPEGKAYLYPDGTRIWKQKRNLPRGFNHSVKRHDLPFDQAKQYCNEHLTAGNALSHILLNAINFEEGSFFTLLPTNAHFDRLLAFSEGGIIDPISAGESESFIPVVDEECAVFIDTYLQEAFDNSAYFDDARRNINDPFVQHNESVAHSYKGEVYFALNSVEKEYISTILIATDQVWHSLCILSPCLPTSSNASDDILFEAASASDYIIISAYDSESYVIWETNRYNGDCKTLFQAVEKKQTDKDPANNTKVFYGAT